MVFRLRAWGWTWTWKFRSWSKCRNWRTPASATGQSDEQFDGIVSRVRSWIRIRRRPWMRRWLSWWSSLYAEYMWLSTTCCDDGWNVPSRNKILFHFNPFGQFCMSFYILATVASSPTTTTTTHVSSTWIVSTGFAIVPSTCIVR